MKMVIFAYGYDQPGIGYNILKILADNNCKTYDIKITSLADIVNVMILVETNYPQDILKDNIANQMKDFSVEVKVLQAIQDKEVSLSNDDDWIPYKLTVICNNITKTLFGLFEKIFSLNINICDICCNEMGIKEDSSYKIIFILEVAVNIDQNNLQKVFNSLARELSVLIDFESVNSLEF